MPTRIKTVALVTGNALVALDMSATIREVMPWAEIVTLTPTLTTPDDLGALQGLLAVVIDQAEAKQVDLERYTRDGAMVIVIGEGEERPGSGIAYLPMPFTTEMLESVLAMVWPRRTA